MRARYILFFFLILFCFISCKKDDRIKTPDYRDRFLGYYLCHKIGVYQCSSTTNFDTIMVVDVKKSGDSSICILDAILKIDTLGGFGGGLYPDSAYQEFEGHISNDSLFFSTYQESFGCYTSLNYNGAKLHNED